MKKTLIVKLFICVSIFAIVIGILETIWTGVNQKTDHVNSFATNEKCNRCTQIAFLLSVNATLVDKDGDIYLANCHKIPLFENGLNDDAYDDGLVGVHGSLLSLYFTMYILFAIVLLLSVGLLFIIINAESLRKRYDFRYLLPVFVIMFESILHITLFFLIEIDSITVRLFTVEHPAISAECLIFRNGYTGTWKHHDGYLVYYGSLCAFIIFTLFLWIPLLSGSNRGKGCLGSILLISWCCCAAGFMVSFWYLAMSYGYIEDTMMTAINISIWVLFVLSCIVFALHFRIIRTGHGSNLTMDPYSYSYSETTTTIRLKRLSASSKMQYMHSKGSCETTGTMTPSALTINTLSYGPGEAIDLKMEKYWGSVSHSPTIEIIPEKRKPEQYISREAVSKRKQQSPLSRDSEHSDR